jgi:hypothetical protein
VTIDASNLSAQDRQRLSLKTGSTQPMPAMKGSGSAKALPGERMDEAEMLAEIDSSKKWFIVAGVAVGVVVLAAILYFFVFRGTPSAEGPPPPKPEAVAAAPPTAPAPAAPAIPPSPPKNDLPPPAAPKANPATWIAEASAEAKKESWAAALDAYAKAAESGGDAKELKKLETTIGKGLAGKLARAKKRHDKASEAEVKALQAKLHAVKGK